MQNHKLLFFVIVLAVCLTQFAADIYAPSLPAIATAFNSPISLAQWSLAIYMLGVALSQLIYGPVSEGIGRKRPLIVGLIIMLLGSFICLSATTINVLIIGRLIQGCGAGACASLWRSIFRDIYTGDDLAKYGSYLVIFIMFIVPAAPALGGYLQQYFGWRSVFTFMCIYTGIAIAAIAYGYTETNRHHHKEKLQLIFVGNTYKKLLTSRVFMGTTLATFLSYGAFFSWFSVGPILLINKLGISPVAFGWFTFFGGGAAYALAGWLNGKLVKRYSIPTMLRFGFSIMILSAILMLCGYMFGVNSFTIMLPIILFYFGSTFIWPNAFATAFTPFGEIAGYAGAAYGFMQTCGAAVIGGLVAHLPSDNQLPLGSVMLIASLAAWMVYERVVNGEK